MKRCKLQCKRTLFNLEQLPYVSFITNHSIDMHAALRLHKSNNRCCYLYSVSDIQLHRVRERERGRGKKSARRIDEYESIFRCVCKVQSFLTPTVLASGQVLKNSHTLINITRQKKKKNNNDNALLFTENTHEQLQMVISSTITP